VQPSPTRRDRRAATTPARARTVVTHATDLLAGFAGRADQTLQMSDMSQAAI
jgi:hypothetical protein